MCGFTMVDCRQNAPYIGAGGSMPLALVVSGIKNTSYIGG